MLEGVRAGVDAAMCNLAASLLWTAGLVVLVVVRFATLGEKHRELEVKQCVLAERPRYREPYFPATAHFSNSLANLSMQLGGATQPHGNQKVRELEQEHLLQ